MAIDGSDGLKVAAELIYPRMPTLLYTWHVNKWIVVKCKGKFKTTEAWEAFYNAWLSLIQSKTEDEFEDRWLQFTTDYDQEEWIKNGQIERLVTAWTNNHKHFNTMVTSRYRNIFSIIFIIY